MSRNDSGIGAGAGIDIGMMSAGGGTSGTRGITDGTGGKVAGKREVSSDSGGTGGSVAGTAADTGSMPDESDGTCGMPVNSLTYVVLMASNANPRLIAIFHIPWTSSSSASIMLSKSTMVQLVEPTLLQVRSYFRFLKQDVMAQPNTLSCWHSKPVQDQFHFPKFLDPILYPTRSYFQIRQWIQLPSEPKTLFFVANI